MKMFNCVGACLFVLAVVNMAFPAVAKDVPDDMSVAAYEAYKKKVEAELESFIDEEYKEYEEDIAILAKPFKVGQEVSVKIKQGTRVRLITGEYKGLEGRKAVIGSQKPLLSAYFPSCSICLT